MSKMDKAAQSALVKKAQGGDRAAFEQLYGEYRDRLFYFALKNVGSREAAEDIVSETFLAALEKLTSLKNADAFGAWLYSIAYNKCSDHLSASAKAQSIDESGLCEPVMLPQDYAENRQTAETVRAIIDGLDKTYRSAVILYYYEELSLSETAKTLGISENAAKQRLFKARAKLKRAFEKHFKDGLLCAVPLGAALEGSAGSGYSVSAKAAVSSTLAGKLAAGLAVAAVGVGVPLGIYAGTGGFGGEYEGDKSSLSDSLSKDAPELDTSDLFYAYQRMPMNDDHVYFFLIDEEGQAFSAEVSGDAQEIMLTVASLRAGESEAADKLQSIDFLGEISDDPRVMEQLKKYRDEIDTAAQLLSSTDKVTGQDSVLYSSYVFCHGEPAKTLTEGGDVSGNTAALADVNAVRIDKVVSELDLFNEWNGAPKAVQSLDISKLAYRLQEVVYTPERDSSDKYWRFLFIDTDGKAYSAKYNSFITLDSAHPDVDFFEMLNSGDPSALVPLVEITPIGELSADETERMSTLIKNIDGSAEYKKYDELPAVEDDTSLSEFAYLKSGEGIASKMLKDFGQLQGVRGYLDDENASELCELIRASGLYDRWRSADTVTVKDDNIAEGSYDLRMFYKGAEQDVSAQQALDIVKNALSDEEIRETAMNTIITSQDVERCKENGLYVSIVFDEAAQIGVFEGVERISIISEGETDGATFSVNGRSVMMFPYNMKRELLQLAGVTIPARASVEIVRFDNDTGSVLAVGDSVGLVTFGLDKKYFGQVDGLRQMKAGDMLSVIWSGDIAESYPGQIVNAIPDRVIALDNDFVDRHLDTLVAECRAEKLDDPSDIYLKAEQIEGLQDREREALVYLAENELYPER